MRTVRSSGRLSGGMSVPGVCVCSRGCLLRGVSAGGVCPGGCLFLGGVCSWGVPAWEVLAWGVSAPGGCLLWGGVCSRGGVWYTRMHWGRHPPCGQTDACKNITFATSLRTVINNLLSKLLHQFPRCKGSNSKGPVTLSVKVNVCVYVKF